MDFFIAFFTPILNLHYRLLANSKYNLDKEYTVCFDDIDIPTAINNTKEQELKSQFAKAYSAVSQALNKTEMNDFYGYAECYLDVSGAGPAWKNNECLAFYDAFFKNLQFQKICQGNSL